MANRKNRIATLLEATAMTVGASVTLGTTDAAAASWTFKKSSVASDGSFGIAASNDGTYAGVMVWNADPGSPAPGEGRGGRC